MTLRELWKIMQPKAKVCVAERDGGEFDFAFVDAIYLPENERIMNLMDREVTEVVPRNNRLYVRVERDEPPSTIEELIRDEGQEAFRVNAKSMRDNHGER